jgi:hypothetical protein
MNNLKNIFSNIKGIDTVKVDRDENMIFVYGNSKGVKEIIGIENQGFEINQIECIGKDLYMMDIYVY